MTVSAPTLDDIGVTKNQSSRWQAIASIPEERFETFVAETQTMGRELTTAGALALARNREAQVTQAEDHWTCIKCDGRGYLDYDPHANR